MSPFDAPTYLGARIAPDPGLAHLELLGAGKVRDVYALDAERLLFVTSDRISAFDVIFDEGVPCKGRVLTAVAAHWFARTQDLCRTTSSRPTWTRCPASTPTRARGWPAA